MCSFSRTLAQGLTVKEELSGDLGFCLAICFLPALVTAGDLVGARHLPNGRGRV